MPYQIKKHNGKYMVVNTQTNHIFSKGTTKAKAIKQERLLYGVENGMMIRKPSKKKVM